LAALALALLYWLPAFSRPKRLAGDDWEYFQHMWEVGWVAARRHRELALWDPFQCGGVPLFGDPQAQLYGPWFLLAFVVGTTLALKLGIVLHAAVALFAMYRYASQIHGLSRVASAYAAAVFTGSGFFAWHIAIGHASFLPFFFLPLVLQLYHQACAERRAVVWLALVLSLMLFEGGVYPLPFSLLLLGFEALVRAARTRRPRESLQPLLLAGVGFALLSGVRWLPSLVELARHPRPVADSDYLGIDDLIGIFTTRQHDSRVPGHVWPWHEYSAFIGKGTLLLSVIGYHLAFLRRRPHAALGAALFVLIACGSLGSAAPWALLQRAPIFDSLRVPTRFLVAGVLFMALLAGLALDALAGALGRWLGRAQVGTLIAATLALLCVTDIALATRPIVDRWHAEPLGRWGEALPFEQTPPDDFRARLARLPRSGQGTLGCYTVLDYKPAPSLITGPAAQTEVTWGEATVSGFHSSVNAIGLRVTAVTDATIAFNQNFSPDFRSNLGFVHEDNGRLAVDVAPGTHELSLIYRPWTLPVGLAITLLGIVVAGAYLRLVASRRPGEDGVAR
jgi:hypothetical protein